MNYYLAIDIGASGGRHMLGHIKNGKMILEEIHRFPNGMERQGDTLCWNVKQLFQEILTGMKKCKELEKVPISVGIDTWAVDFVLLDSKNQLIGNAIGYRDKRTEGMDEVVYSILSEENLYESTGIQKQIFNTIYQLMAVKKQNPKEFHLAESLLLIPDYFHFQLTGVKKTEYTNATTTQLVNPYTKEWDMELIEKLGFPNKIFQEIKEPGTNLGYLTKEIEEQVGYNCQVILPATHDTGSAVVAIPSVKEDTLYISSGTWSLMGIERKNPDCSQKSREGNFTNEGGYEYRFRYLKNIMGLWMIQSIQKEFPKELSFTQICAMASKEGIPSIVDCNDSRFLAPKSMVEEVRMYCMETKQEVPETEGQIACVIYNSLAACYKRGVKEIEEITDKVYDCIHIVGGGANADYLNELTGRKTKKKIYAGPTEATAIGNMIVQMIASNELKGLREARGCIYHSFKIKEFYFEG